MYLVLTPTPLAMLSSCHQVTIGLQIISRLEWIHQVTTSTFVDHVGIEPTTLSLQGRNAKPWYMTALLFLRSHRESNPALCRDRAIL
jgi:hypothetical protein